MTGYLAPTKKVRLADFARKKADGEKWAMLTAYDYATARVFSQAGIECLLVGDSAANVVYGYDTTNQVSVDEMAFLGAAVVRGAGHALVIMDLPFGSYEASDEQCVRTATDLVRRTGAHMVKLEGDVRIAPRIRALKNAGLAVCAHVGFTPQSVDNLSGFKVQGRDAGADQLRDDVNAVVESGADMVVFEMVPADLAAELTAPCPVPTVGIGAGAGTDAQVLVWHDMADIPAGDHRAKFVRKFGSVGTDLAAAAADYKRAVHTGEFPGPEHAF